MSALRDIKILHLEPTDVCQASCLLCARETNSNFDKDQQHHLTMQAITKVFDVDRIALLDKMFMCGDYGDPAAGRHTLDIYQQFRKINPAIVLGMNTNGAVRSTDWWRELANIFNGPKDYVVFSIDGLEDTNHVYRRGVEWKKLMANVESFIVAGGSAHWDMLVYRHNEHQVEQCQQLAKSMGFKWFRSKVSRRPYIGNLQPPTQWIQPAAKAGPINCIAKQDKSMYINAQGKTSPCCWLGIDLDNQITDIIQVEHTWSSDSPNPVCKKICGTATSSQFADQWQLEVQL